MRRVDIWDGWRGLAISLLLVGHFFPPNLIEDIARLGVDLFFALSGMLMSKILFEKRMNLRDFYIRRFSRIYPALLMFVLAAFTIATVTGWAYSPSEFFANLVFLRTYWPAEPHLWDTLVPVGHLWSLNVEEHAYVLMSLLTLLFMRNRHVAVTLIALALLSVGIAIYQSIGSDIHARFRIRTECAISFVFLSAGYNLIKNRMAFRPHPYLPVLTLFLAIACYFEVAPLWTRFTFAPVLLAFTANHMVDSARPMQAVLDFKPLRMMGLWSYSIYLWQQPFYSFKWAIPFSAVTGPMLGIMIGFLSFQFFENPIRSYINRRWTNRYEPVK